MKALVTGGTGFLGRHVVRDLLARGAYVRCVIRPGGDAAPLLRKISPEHRDRLTFFETTLGRIELQAADGCDTVFHIAAEMKGAVPTLVMTNVVGTRNLIQIALRANVSRFVMVSSIAVYGTSGLSKGTVIDETCAIEPEPHRRDNYTYSKVLQEGVAWQAFAEDKLPLTVIRPGVIFGPGRDCISGRVGLKVGGVLLKMGGRQTLPYTYIDNCAQAVVLAGDSSHSAGEAFNVVDDNAFTANQLLREYRKCVGRVRTITVPHFAIRPLSRLCNGYHHFSRGQLPAVLTPYKSDAMWTPFRYSNTKAKEVLQWHPHIDFATGLKDTFQAAKAVSSEKRS